MENFKILLECTGDIQTILGLVNTVLNVIRWVIPAILIVMGTLDIAKVVISSENDEKEVKAATKKLTTRVIYAVVVFLIPTIVSALFSLITLPGADVSIIDCMRGNSNQK